MVRFIHKVFRSQFVLKTMQKLIGTDIYITQPFGLNSLIDIKNHFSNFEMKLIFDIGANIGQSENEYFKLFPNAKIHCFEPIPATFSKLKSNVRSPKTECHNLALGAIEEKVEIMLSSAENTSTANSIVNNKFGNDGVKVQLDCSTLDLFLTRNKIEAVDYVKIDTEGYDLNVLKGAKDSLKSQKIKFVEVECSMNKLNNFHVAFEEIKTYMEDNNYYLFGVYEQKHDFIRIKKMILQRSNLLFVSNLYAQNWK